MHDVFQRFVDRLTARPDTSALTEILTETLTELEIESYAYLLTIPVGRHSGTRLISNYPSAWTAHYLEHRYQVIDPVIVEAGRVSRSFRWGALDPWSDPQAEFFEEAARFGIRSGFTVPVRDHRPYHATLTFASDDPQSKFDRAIERHGVALELIATLFHRAARRVLIPERVVRGIVLSPREFDCLTWSAKGKTAWEISIILDISQRTVVGYLESAKHKLGVFSLSEAVACLIEEMTRF